MLLFLRKLFSYQIHIMTEIPNSLSQKSRDVVIWFLFVFTIITTLSAVLGSIKSIKDSLTTNLHIQISTFDTLFKVSMECFNILVLVVFYLIIKATRLNFRNGETEDNAINEIISFLRIEDSDRYSKLTIFNKNVARVNSLVKQLAINISWFVGLLLAFYIVNIIEDQTIYSFEGQDLIKNHILPFCENLFNFSSAIFIFLAFQVLYNRTLDDENERLPYYRSSIVIFVSYLILYFFSIASGNKDTSNIFRIICGIYNGFAMGLLFGRFTSMEYLFKNVDFFSDSNQTLDKKWYHIGTIYILPLYVIAQPFFGIFNLEGFGDQHVFKSVIFLICGIGKFTFLFLFYDYVKNKWLHIYLHVSLANHGIPKNLINYFLR